jgi:hypothetical protein
MAGGDPCEIFQIGSLKVQRYKLVLGVMATIGLTAYSYSKISSLRSPSPVKYESEEEKEFVKKYVEFRKQQLHVPELARIPFKE